MIAFCISGEMRESGTLTRSWVKKAAIVERSAARMRLRCGGGANRRLFGSWLNESVAARANSPAPPTIGSRIPATTSPSAAQTTSRRKRAGERWVTSDAYPAWPAPIAPTTLFTSSWDAIGLCAASGVAEQEPADDQLLDLAGAAAEGAELGV